MFASNCGVADKSVGDSGIEMIPEVWLTRGADLYMVENVIKRSESLSLTLWTSTAAVAASSAIKGVNCSAVSKGMNEPARYEYW